ncbi:MAG: hypothetical protein U0Q16_00700 [Bryobacteraceae bacterium]
MASHFAYLIYAVTLILGCAWLEYRGIGMINVNEGKVVPQSIRNNPGGYRSSYSSSSHYSGGK